MQSLSNKVKKSKEAANEPPKIIPREPTPKSEPEPVAQWYDYTAIDKIDSVYKIVIGERSNGKTFGWCRKVIDEYLTTGKPSAYIRRLDEQIKPKFLANLFDPHIDYIIEKSKGKWNHIRYWQNNFYLERVETLPNGVTKKMAKDDTAFCRTYAVNTAETSKGADNGEIKYVCFDEFITRRFYLANEFILFQNLLSSIIRKRTGITIYMLANTVNKFCPYFAEMGLRRVAKQQQGTIDVYQMGKTNYKIAIEYCATAGISKKAESYFAFDNPQLDMIRSGSWEIASYRHAPQGLKYHRIVFSFFVVFDSQMIQGDIYMYDGFPICFFHPKTTEIKEPEKSIIYTQDTIDGNPLHQTDVRVKPTRAQRVIADIFNQKKTFYSDNECGELVNNWVKWMTSSRTSIKI